MEHQRIPPHDDYAEQGVLGSAIIDHRCVDDILERVKPEYFYNHNHKTVFEAIQSLFRKKMPIDIITMEIELNESNLDDENIFRFVADLAKKTPSSANYSTYIEIVKSDYLAREAIYHTQDAQNDLYTKPREERISSAMTHLSTIGDSIDDVVKKDIRVKAGLQRYVEKTEQLLKSKTGISGIRTGLRDLDKKIGGFEKSDLIIEAGRPSMGKTTLALKHVVTEALSGGYPFVFSMEMPEEQLYRKAISIVGRIDGNRLKNPNNPDNPMTEEDWTNHTNAVGKLISTNLAIDDRSNLSPMEMRIAIKKYKRDHGHLPTLIMVDYLQLMKSSNKENRTQQISEISMGLKAIAKDFEVPVIALSQLNRSLENRADKRPICSDLRESGQLEQDADIIIFIYRDEVYNENTPNKGLAEIIVGKQRNGPLGMIGSVFMGQYSDFGDMSHRVFMEDEQPGKKPNW